MGAVKGEVVTDHNAGYVRQSDSHFTLTLSDAEYDRVMATVERWRTRRQPSYDLGTRNCIHFVAEIAASVGMRADTPKQLMKKPRSYLDFLTGANRPGSRRATRSFTVRPSVPRPAGEAGAVGLTLPARISSQPAGASLNPEPACEETNERAQ